MTDGTDTVTFMDGAGGATAWPPVASTGWGPSITGIRTSQMAGRGPYADVQEDLTCNIVDTTAALCWQDLDTLVRLLDKAERWWLRGEPISPVILKYVAQGSTIHSSAGTVMQAIVLGRVGTDELNGVDLPQTTNNFMGKVIQGVRVLCMRRGGWTGANDTVTAGASGQATAITITYASTHPVASPVSVQFLGFGTTTTPTIQPGFAMIGSLSSDIQVFEAETGTATAYTSVADAANNARGGSVLRYTPTGTTAANTGGYTIASSISGTIAIYAAVRNNSGTTTFQIAANVYGLGSLSSTPTQTIDTSSTQPRLLYLGSAVVTSAVSMNFTVTASAASGTFDIDYFVLVNLRDETVAVVSWDQLVLATYIGGTVTLEMDFNFNPLADQAPQASMRNSAGTVSVPLTYHGPLPFLTKGGNIYALWASTNGAKWQFTNVTPAVLTPTPQVTRYKCFLSPQ